MVKHLLVFLLLLGAGWLGCLAPAYGQCAPTPNSGACFKAYDAATGQELPFYLCANRPVRLRDCSGKNLDPAQIYYQRGTAITCSGFTDTATTFTPTAAGTLVISQNTQGPQGGSQGIIYSRTFEVKTTPEPSFTLTTCAPGFVEVTVTDTHYDQYVVQVGSGTPVPAARNTTVTYPYSTNGAATVTVTGRYAIASLCAGTSTRPFTPLPAPRQPVLTRLGVEGSTAQFQFGPLQPEYQYRLQIADAAAAGGFRTVATVPGGTATSFALSNAPLPGCYRLLLQDACQPAVASSPSATVCSVSLTGTALSGRNQLSWSTGSTGPFTLTRTDGSNTVQLPVPAGATQYEDPDVACGTTYRYRLSVATGPATSVSDEVPVTASAGPAPAAPRLRASFTLRNQVELQAAGPGTGPLTYLRNGSVLATTAARTFLDSLITPAPGAELCYTVRQQDACGNRSAESTAVCPVVLAARPEAADGSTIRLRWTALREPDAGAPVSYRVLALAATNAVLSSRPVSSGLTFLDLQPPPDQQVVRYRIEATAGTLVSYSNVATVARRVQVFVPTAFTPNGDGLNDVLALKGRYLENFRFIIIDRNGQPVFQATTRTQTWDGRIGTAAPVPGAYVWRFETTDQLGNRLVQTGTVTLLR